MAKKSKPGAAFKKVERSAAKSGASNPKAVAAAVGIKKYGVAGMERKAQAGKRRAARGR